MSRDRRDGVFLRKIDSMHVIMPLIYPNRCDNEAFISETIDITNIKKYLEEKNANNPEYKYNIFQVIVTAILKTITLRPKMNRFIANKLMYQRKEVSAAFTIKKVFEDESEEGLAFIHAKDTDTLETVHNDIYRQVHSVRHEKRDKSSESMDAVNKLPIPLVKMVGFFARILDRYGIMPKSVIATDPYYSSCVISNLGSIKLHAGYHHLTNWGTTSLFCVIGEMKKRPFYDDNGNVEMRDSVDLTLTVDERIADGYYYSKTIRLIKKLLENPELLDRPFNEEIEY